MPRSSRLATVVALATAVVLGVLGTGATAAWNVTGTGNGAARAGSLVTPTAVTTTALSASAIRVGWTDTNQLGGVTYTLSRTPNGSSTATSVACANNPCTDSGLDPATQYSYVVNVKIGSSWVVSSAAATGTTGGVPATTTTVTSSQNPAKSGVTVTLTATVSSTSGGTPSGTVTFQDGGSSIACTGGAVRTLSTGSATCQTSFSAVGAHSITATYSGSAVYAGSTSAVFTQRIVNGNVTGLAFANVKVNGTAVSPTCNGVGTATVTCSVNGANNSTITADAGFVNASGSATTYATDAATALAWEGFSKGVSTGSGSLSVAAGGTTSATGAATATKIGSNVASITVTFTQAGNTFTATLTN